MLFKTLPFAYDDSFLLLCFSFCRKDTEIWITQVTTLNYHWHRQLKNELSSVIINMTHILLLLLSASSSNNLPTLQPEVSLLKPLRQTSHRNDFVNAIKSHASEKPLFAAYSLPNFYVLQDHTWLVIQSNEVVLLLISWS